ncbi:MAG: GGDEF domain-containing protein [Ruminococcus sp.]|nr:GGDEF domain-containing protein [Ruminococcus sp.]
MDKRKRIAVLAADIANDYMNRICAGIEAQAKALGYDAIVLLMSFNINTSPAIEAGEENIYRLLTSDNIDGVIFLTGNIASFTLINWLTKYIEKLGVPTIAIDNEYRSFESIYADDTDIFEKMTDHFIDHHQCKDIICLTGFQGMSPSETRAAGYKRSMEKHGLTVGYDDIIYGDFWRDAAEALADEIGSGKRRKPEAVVCANDSMGIYLCQGLAKYGIRVPEDIMVSGYDGSREAIECIPSLTTIFPENSTLGARAVCALHKMITGEEAELVKCGESSLILAGSCGCNLTKQDLIDTRTEFNTKMGNYELFFNNSGMAEGLMQSENLDHLLHLLSNYIYIIDNIEILMINLCHEWDSFENLDETDYLRNGYSELMDTKLIYNNTRYDYEERRFNSHDIIPEYMSEISPEPSMYILLPLHFMDRCFGYTIFKFFDINTTVSKVFSLWNRNINIALEFLRVRTKLTAINQRISLSSLRDTLTGVYNRQGFNKFSETLFRRAKAEEKNLLILMADLDLLKHINDNFGHVEGDNAIIVVANGLTTCCSNNEICARIGGDEYAIVGCYDYTDEIVASYTTYINDFFDRYNAASDKPYRVGASIGLFCGIPSPDRDLSYYIDIADKRMYDNKMLRKKMRTD